MKQIKFGKVSGEAAKSMQAPTARVPVANEDRLRLSLLIATGIVTGFVAAAIECL